ncbi:uncharacterized protein LOC110727061 isoform X2 [Chenopodium quinoa]|uniref:uncharacterized protein LOC110727061 isoform X2 n=1 Tax=Chenopodium quinoa TaxID=63459 RepID=UPI000B79680A|nr:uncharacterized protein LOC110727061 isoform X2 [Chenopodium quinoa]
MTGGDESPPPPPSKIKPNYQLVIHEERICPATKEFVGFSGHQIPDSSQSAVVDFAVTTGLEAAPALKRGQGRTAVKPPCSRYRHPGHDAASFWADTICSTCNMKAHPQSHCFDIVGRPNNKSKKQGPRRAYMAVSPPSSSISTLGNLFTQEQWKAIMGLIGSNEGADWNGNRERWTILF